MMEWVYENMNLLKLACKEVGDDLRGYKIAIAFPLEYKTAVLIGELSRYCEVLVTPFSPGTTKEEVISWLNIEILDVSKAIEADYYLDCAATLVRESLTKGCIDDVKGVVELTRSGVSYLRNVKRAIVVDDSTVKGVGENVYGTGMGLMDGLLRLNLNLLGKTVAIVGFGRVGRGCAYVLRNFCRIVVVEIDPIKAMEAVYEGYEVLDLQKALEIADIVVTCTGSERVIGCEHFEFIKNGCIVCNMGAFKEIETPRWEVKEYGLIKKYYKNDKYFYVVADCEPINLAIGNGTPIEIMDRTFATVVYALHYLIKEDFSGVIPLPKDIEKRISEMIIKHVSSI